MTQISDELSRLAEAERRLCESASPLLDAIVSLIERRCRIAIGEIRITFDRTDGSGGFAKANCTIVQATLDTAPKLDTDTTDSSWRDPGE